MTEIHILREDGQQQICTESDVQAWLAAGQIAPDTYCWKPGMSDWRPLHEIVLNPASAPGGAPYPHAQQQSLPQSQLQSHPHTLHPKTYRYLRDPRKLNKALMTMLWLYLGASLLMLVTHGMQWSLLSGEFTPEEKEINDLRLGGAALLYLGCFLITAFLFLRWMHRTTYNAHGFGAKSLSCSPGWAIGWFFVPFANLVKPYQCMKENLQVSQDPARWTQQPTNAFLGWWWTLWLLSILVSQFYAYYTPESPQEWIIDSQLAMLMHLSEIAVTFVAIRLIQSIVSHQETLVQGTQPAQI